MASPSTTFLAGFDYSSDRPALVLGVPSQNERTTLPIIGTTMTIRRMRRRYCIGRYDLATFATSACPDQAVLDDDAKGTRCDRCEYFCGFNPGFYRTDVMSPQQRAYSEHPHDVYLAYFGRGATKVGIGHARRLRTRLLEQGARAAIVISQRRDAFSARSLEERISSTGLPEHLSSSAKRRLLNERFDVNAAFDELREMRVRIAAMGAVAAGEREYDPFDLTPSQINHARLRLPMLDLSNSRPLAASGRGVGLIGDTLIVEQQGGMFMIGLKQMVSHTVMIEFAEVMNASSPAQQASLF